MRTTWPLLAVLLLIPRAGASQGDPIGPEFRVNTYTTNDQSLPSVATDSAGNFVVVWNSHLQDGPFGDGVFGQRYAASGVPIGPEFRVNTYTTSNQNSVSLAADSAGNFVVVWSSNYQDGSGVGVFGQRYSSSGAPLGSEFRVNTHTTNNQYFAAVATDQSGNFIVVWESVGQDGSGRGVFGQRFSTIGVPLGPEFRVNTYTTAAQFFPFVASDPFGDFVVVWTSFEQAGVFGQRYDSSGAPLGSEFRLNTDAGAFQVSPRVALDSGGNFVVVWESSGLDGDSSGIFGQRFSSSGVPLGPQFRVNTYTTDTQDVAWVASDSTGGFVVVWQSDGQDGDQYGVFGQRFSSSGPLGPEFRVNTHTTNHQSFAGVTSDPMGHFVVVWTGRLQDGSEGGIFGQRFDQIVPVELMHSGVE